MEEEPIGTGTGTLRDPLQGTEVMRMEGNDPGTGEQVEMGIEVGSLAREIGMTKSVVLRHTVPLLLSFLYQTLDAVLFYQS